MREREPMLSLIIIKLNMWPNSPAVENIGTRAIKMCKMHARNNNYYLLIV